MTVQTGEFATYVYGVTWNLPKAEVARWGTGVDEASDIFLFPYQEIAAVVSKVRLADFTEEALDARLQDLEWLQAKGGRHEAVIRQAMQSAPVIPMRFCSIYREQENLRVFLAEHYQELRDHLEAIKDKEEWDIKVFCVPEKLRARALAQPRLQKLELESQIPGGKGYLLKKRLEGLITETVEQLKAECASEFYHALARYGERGKTNKLLSKDVTGRSEEMILNAGYLVPKAQAAQFQEEFLRLEAAEQEWGFLFFCSGPWPPYNFSPSVQEGDEQGG